MQTSPRTWRVNANLSMAKAAKIGGVVGKNPARTWQRWETGELEPPLHVVSTIAIESGGAVTLQSWIDLRHSRFSAASASSFKDRADGAVAVLRQVGPT